MPNHVANKLSFRGKADAIKALKKFIKPTKVDKENEENTVIDFGRIIPMPDELRITAGSATDYGMAVVMFREENNPSGLLPVLEYPWVKDEGIKTPKQLADHLVKTKHANLIEGKQALENLKKYGSKDWYDWSCKNWGTKWNAYSQIDEGDMIEFSTAWASPIPVIEELSRLHPAVEIALRFADEDFGQNCGEVVFKKGKVISENIPEGGSTEALILAGDVQGYDLNNFIDYYGESDDEDFIENLLVALAEKFKSKDIVETAVSAEHISITFLNKLKESLLIDQEFELIPSVNEKIKELEDEADEEA